MAKLSRNSQENEMKIRQMSKTVNIIFHSIACFWSAFQFYESPHHPTD